MEFLLHKQPVYLCFALLCFEESSLQKERGKDVRHMHKRVNLTSHIIAVGKQI